MSEALCSLSEVEFVMIVKPVYDSFVLPAIHSALTLECLSDVSLALHLAHETHLILYQLHAALLSALSLVHERGLSPRVGLRVCVKLNHL